MKQAESDNLLSFEEDKSDSHQTQMEGVKWGHASSADIGGHLQGQGHFGSTYEKAENDKLLSFEEDRFDGHQT